MSRRNYRRISNFKKLTIISVVTLAAAIIAFVVTYAVYRNKLKENINESLLKAEDLSDLIANQNATNLLEEANSQIGKSIEESIQAQEVDSKIETISPAPTTVPVATPTPTPMPTPEPMPEFIMPVEGVVIREFANESLLYSPTLDEWVTHLGIDIEAAKTSVVKASAAGTVTAIKNDPRYGLTVVIEHTRGFKTVYSNLLTAEYVSVGEKVSSGQTIGTVGNTATFEILDNYHLHFEILENDEYVDPSLYVK